MKDEKKWSNSRFARYEKSGAVKRVQVKFTKVDNDLIDHLAKQDNVSGYIKQLIREDMERQVLREQVTERVCRAFGVPLDLIDKGDE